MTDSTTVRMHRNEVVPSVAQVRQMLDLQFPEWSELTLARVRSAGTDHALYRLGDELVVRLPRIRSASGQVMKEQYWLPLLAPHLPLHIPRPIALGEPAQGYPFPWSVYRWLPGENATLERLNDPLQAARDLAVFVKALQNIDSTDGPLPDEFNAWRGVNLAHRDANTMRAISELSGAIDTARVTAIWKRALSEPSWQGSPVWLHGDLQPSNLLAQDRRLSAVIDFGCMGIGDPACDVMAAWLYLDSSTRIVFRDTLQIDDATWSRARGWALSVGLIALPYYRLSNPALAAIARRAIDETVADCYP